MTEGEDWLRCGDELGSKGCILADEGGGGIASRSDAGVGIFGQLLHQEIDVSGATYKRGLIQGRWKCEEHWSILPHSKSG